MPGLGNLVATPGSINTAQGSIEAKVDAVRSEVVQRPKEAAIKTLLQNVLGATPVNLGTEFTGLRTVGTEIKTGVDALAGTAAEIKTEVTTGVDARLNALKSELSKEIQSKKKLGFKGFLVRAGLATAAALPAIAYLQENGLDFNPMVGGVGQAWNEISGAVGEKWNQIFPPAEDAPATGAATAS